MKPSALLLFLVCTTASLAQSPAASQKNVPNHMEEVRQLLVKLSPESSGPCEPPFQVDHDPTKVESALFDQTVGLVTERLNDSDRNDSSPRDRVQSALGEIEKASVEINAAWPADSRFHFQLLELQPLLVMKLSIRAHATFFAFAASEEKDGKWGARGSDTDFQEQGWPASPIDLYPLYRGPSGNARFLARIFYMGCAGSYGVVYDAREWDAKSESLNQIVKQAGSIGLSAPEEGTKPSPKFPFAPVGKFRAAGSRITLPYCSWSVLDDWDNPNLCAVDTYDLSGETVRFIGRSVNRPDLLPVAKVVEYAGQHDYEAVLAYSTSAAVARKIVSVMPPGLIAEDLRVKRINENTVRVELGFPSAYRFVVRRVNGQWRIAAFDKQE